MLGLSWWMRSQVRPQFGNTSALKFSTMASHLVIRRSTILMPSGVARVEADCELAVMQRVEVRIGVELLLALHMIRLRRIGGDAAVSRETMIVPAAGALDVDHLRAVMREQPRCPRPDGFPGEIEHADAAQHAFVPMGGIVCRRLRCVIGRRLFHLIAPAAVSAAISCTFSP